MNNSSITTEQLQLTYAKHNGKRNVYTNHHDYLRCNVKCFENASRSEIAKTTENTTDDHKWLYAVALAQVLKNMPATDILVLSNEDRAIFIEAVSLTKTYIKEFEK